MFELFITFAKIGIMTFGGGLAMLPILEREIVDNKKWVTKETLLDYYSIGQCTPGIIAVNVATFVGRKEKGFWGSVCATFGVVFPSIVIILILAIFFSSFTGNEVIDHAFAGARVVVCVLVLNSLIKLLRNNIKDYLSLGIFIACSLLSILFKLSPIIIVIAAVIVALIDMRRKDK